MRNEIGKQCTGYEHIGKVTSVVCFLIISMWHIYLMIILILIFTMMIIMMRMIFTAFLVQKQWRWTVFDDCQDWWNSCSICCFTGNVSYFIVRP